MNDDDTLLCPRDGTALDPRTYEAGVEVDSCLACRGMWLDAEELEAIQETVEHDHRAELEDIAAGSGRTGVVSSRPEGVIACPVCGVEMEAREYAYCSGVMIDACVEGCGVWLDAGEIQALERFFEEASGARPTLGRSSLWSSLGTILAREP